MKVCVSVILNRKEEKVMSITLHKDMESSKREAKNEIADLIGGRRYGNEDAAAIVVTIDASDNALWTRRLSLDVLLRAIDDPESVGYTEGACVLVPDFEWKALGGGDA